MLSLLLCSKHTGMIRAQAVEEHSGNSGHSYTSKVTEPTCTECGYTTYRCSCGSSYVDDHVAAVGHNYSNGKCQRCQEKAPVAYGQCGVTVYWKIDKNNELTIYGCGNMYSYDMCEAPWHDYADQITGVSIGDRVTSIGSYAFCDFTALKTLSIPSNIETIGDSALFGCGNLRQLTIPFVGANKKATSSSAKPFGYIFGETGFANCIDVEHINGTFYYVPKSLTTVTVTGGSLYAYAFHNCTRVVTINLRDNVNTLEPNAFSGCTSLENLNIASGLTSINDYTFKECVNLKKVTIGNSVTSIGYEAFYGCTSLESIVLPKSLKIISDRAFYNCSKLKNADLPASLTYIGSEAFYNCSKLESVCIPYGITYLAGSAFANCKGMTELILPNSLTNISEYTFYGCASLTEVKLSSNLNSMGTYAFAQCTSLEQITIPGKLKIVPEYAFSGCTGLQRIELSRGITTISDYAFSECSSLQDISMESVAKIESYAFYNCTSLKSVELPEFLGTLESGVFIDCTALETITLPENIVKVPSYLFQGCTSLKEVTFSPDTKSIGYATFQNCTALTSIKLPDVITSLDEYIFSGSGLTSINIPDSVTAIGPYAFADCAALKTVTMGDKVKTIGAAAFSNCKALKSIVIHDNVESMGDSIFYKCQNLEKVTIGSKVKTIGAAAFSNCKALKSIVIPDNVESMGNAIFYECQNLEEVTIGKGVKAIPSDSFYSCCNLKKVIVGSGVKSIGKGAFHNCSSLNILRFLGNAPQFHNEAFRWSRIICYYPAGNATWTKDVRRNYGAEDTMWRSANEMDEPVLTVTGDKSNCNRSILSWPAVEGAVKYEVYGIYAFDTGDLSLTDMVKLTTTQKTKYNDTKMLPGQCAYYAVAAVDRNGNTSVLSNFCWNQCKLDAPVITASNDASTGGVKLSWKGVKDASYYIIYSSNSPNGSYNDIGFVYATDFTGSYVTHSTEYGQKYFYKVKAAYDDAHNVDSNIVSRTVDLPCPTLTVTHTASGKAELSWKSIKGVEKYEIWRSTDNANWKRIFTTTNTTFINTSMEIGVKYYYKVRALHENSNANSAYSSVKSITCKLKVPTVKASNVASTGQVKFSWKAIDGAVKYKIYYINDWDWEDGKRITLATTTDTSYTTNLPKSFEGCSFQVQAIYSTSAGNSEYSSTIFARILPPQPVVKLSNDQTTGYIKMDLENISNVWKVYIYRSDSKDGTYRKIKTVIPSTADSYTDKNVQFGKTYYYKVTTCWENGAVSPESKVVSCMATLSQPQLNVSCNDNGKPVLSWGAVKNAAKYEIWRSRDKSNWSCLSTTTKKTLTDASAVSGVKYYYKIRALHENFNANSAYSSVKNITCKLKTPTVRVSNVASTGQIKLSWKAIEGAVKYEIRYLEPDGWGEETEFVKLATTTNTSYTTNLPETFWGYSFRVRAIYSSSAGNSAYSGEVSAYRLPAKPVVKISTVEATGKIKLVPENVNARGLEVYRATSRDGFYEYNDCMDYKDNYILDNYVEPGKTYYYKVKSCYEYSDQTIREAESKILSCTADLPRPELKVSRNSKGKPVLSWGTVNGAVKYEIWRSADNSNWSKLSTTTNTSKTDDTAKQGKTYYYKVRAIHENTNANSAYSTVKSIKVK